MVWLNRQPNHLPLMFLSHLMNDGHQPIMNGAVENLAPPLGTPDDMVDHEMNGVVFVLIVHVGSLVDIYVSVKGGAPFIPRLKDGGFLAPLCK